MLAIDRLTVDGAERPLGIDQASPAFGWRLTDGGSGKRGLAQSAYRILVASGLEALNADNGDCWDSGIVRSGESQHAAYGGVPFRSGVRYVWKAKIWDQDGNDCGWSEASAFETGLMEESDWRAGWISDPARPVPEPEPDRLAGVAVVWDGETASAGDGASSAKRWFRLTLRLPEGTPSSAKLETYAADALHLYVNGQDEGLYYPYMQAVTLDIADLIVSGGTLTIAGCSDGERQGFVAALAIDYPDGASYRATTDDPAWKTTDREAPGWTSPGFDDGAWRPASRIGVFGEGDWTGYKRILYPVNRGYGPCPRFATTVHVAAPVARARLYASALGVYRACVNGEPVGSDALAPGWTDYRIRIPYQTYDVTALLREGDNDLAGTVGPGWYAGHLGICGPYHYGSSVAFKAQLHIEYADGRTETIATNADWRASDSSVLSSDIYMGETVDARIKPSEAAWRRAQAHEAAPGGRMVAQLGPPIKPMLELEPKEIRRIDDDTQLIDMGQNMTGWIRLGVRAEAGTRIVVRHAERLTPEGRLYRDNLRTAKQIDVYVAGGGQAETFEPSFTYHGFQYVEIEGYPGDLTAADVRGIVIHTALEDAGRLATSDPLVNRLVDNIRWSQRGNFMGIALDCPQRDERLGWTGDAHMFSRTATYNMASAPFYRKWLVDIRDAQGEDGAFPDVAPFVEHFGRGHVFFADGGVIMPWTMYKVYGDRRFVEDNYDAMRRYVDYLVGDSDERLVRRTESFGDHLSNGADTSRPIMNLFLFAYSVSLMTEMAGVMNDEAGAARYRTLFETLRRTFAERHLDAEGKIADGSQTAYVLALKIGLLSEEGRAIAKRELVNDIAARGERLTTGFMGAAYVLPMLSELGEHELAARLLLRREYPSWLYPVTQGATTIWERWDGWTEEKGFQDPEMNSFNHFALGAVGEWMYRYLAGIDIPEGEYGFRRVKLKPLPAEGLTSVSAAYDSEYGTIASEWTTVDGGLTLTVEVPPNVVADIEVPAGAGDTVEIDGSTIDVDTDAGAAGDGWLFVGRSERAASFAAGSGRYTFRVRSHEHTPQRES
ncbi:family 78 glycoside hydrolase catalytic domain [Cohnella sp. GCM10027633]|uniref:family 78 glycoside hydrolase catalytic domain n=1 Tax=unclassified Cohnella TaxID=2636738 RepID=UPI003645087E